MTVADPFVIEADDPCLDGHFPGNPLVPGVVVLDVAAQALAMSGIRAAVIGVARVKFASPLRPREPLTIECGTHPGGACAQFRCSSGARLIAEGVFLLEASPST